MATIPDCQSLLLMRLHCCEIRVTEVLLEVHRRATEGIQKEANKLYWLCSSINFLEQSNECFCNRYRLLESQGGAREC